MHDGVPATMAVESKRHSIEFEVNVIQEDMDLALQENIYIVFSNCII